MRKPLIGIDASRANWPQRTGVEWYAYHVVQELKTIVPEGFQVRLYVREPLRDGLEKDLPEHWEVRVLPHPSRLWTQLRLSLEMLLHPPDVLFVPAHAMPIMLPHRSVVTVHDVAFMTEKRAYSWYGRWYLMFAAWFAAQFATRILTVSAFSKGEIVRLFRVPEKRIAVTHLAPDTTRFVPVRDSAVRAEVAARYGISGPYLLFVGRLERKKNIRRMLQAFRECKRRFPEMAAHRFVLVGKPGRGYADELQDIDRVPSPGAAPDVLEVGYVRSEDLAPLLSGADALVFATLYEGFGIPPLEAMACGTPVIASRTTSLPEICGDAALYVDPGSTEDIARAMRRIVVDRARAADLSARGLAHAVQFSWRATAERTWEEIRKALE